MRGKPALPPADAAARLRQTRRALAALRAGATAVAVMGGLACYLLLGQGGVAPLWAGIVGFVFALGGRLAMVALGREWLLAAAARQASAPPRAGGRP